MFCYTIPPQEVCLCQYSQAPLSGKLCYPQLPTNFGGGSGSSSGGGSASSFSKAVVNGSLEFMEDNNLFEAIAFTAAVGALFAFRGIK